MLHKPNQKSANCHRHAADCRARADETLDAPTRTDFLDMEQRWLSRARSYEVAERIGDAPKALTRPTGPRAACSRVRMWPAADIR
jgi:hypothetical protein